MRTLRPPIQWLFRELYDMMDKEKYHKLRNKYDWYLRYTELYLQYMSTRSRRDEQLLLSFEEEHHVSQPIIWTCRICRQDREHTNWIMICTYCVNELKKQDLYYCNRCGLTYLSYQMERPFQCLDCRAIYNRERYEHDEITREKRKIRNISRASRAIRRIQKH